MCGIAALSSGVPAGTIPVLVFLIAAVVSFATGAPPPKTAFSYGKYMIQEEEKGDTQM